MELNLDSTIWEAVQIIQERRDEISRLQWIVNERKAQLEELDKLFYEAMFIYDAERNEIHLGNRNLGNSYRLMKKTTVYWDEMPEWIPWGVSESVFLTPNIDYLLDEDPTVTVLVLKYDLIVSKKNPMPRLMLWLGESFFNPLDIAYVHPDEYPIWFQDMSHELQDMITNAQVEVETQIGGLQRQIDALKKLDVQR